MQKRRLNSSTMMMEKLVPLVNRLQEVLNTVGRNKLDLPQIVVVGSQSAGKSSVLESIVGKEFLPRGTGIVTRRPLILQLCHRKAKAEDHEIHEYGEFAHLPNRPFYDFHEIRKEIERDTVRVAGDGKIISSTPILVKIHSDRVVDLTLVDLPGLTKIPVGGQPDDIEVQIRDLVMEYIRPPSSIILAISPANNDLANSDSLRLAREVDPQGYRTIGVLTKLDLMESGNSVADILLGKTYSLKLGFIGVVNKSFEQDMTAGSMERRRELEAEFFRSHPSYRAIAHKCGHQYLAETLNEILMHHIREKLPELKADLNMLISQTQRELTRMGEQASDSGAHVSSLMLRLLTKYANDFSAVVDGTNADVSTRQLCGGARIYYIFNDIFRAALDSISPAGNLTMEEIRTAIRNSTGARPSLFIPEAAFDLLVNPQIARLLIPSVRCVELVFDELNKIAHECSARDLERFPKLQQRVVEVVVDLLKERLSPTSQYVESLVQIQQAYINTNHPDFVGAKDAYAYVERGLRQENEFTPSSSLNANGGRRRKVTRRTANAEMENQNPSSPTSQRSREMDSFGNARTGTSTARPNGPPSIGGDQSQANPFASESPQRNARSMETRSVESAPTTLVGSEDQSNSQKEREGFFGYFFGSGSKPKSPELPMNTSSAPTTMNNKSQGTFGPGPNNAQPSFQPNYAPSSTNDSRSQLSVSIREERMEDLFRPTTSVSDREEFETRLIRSLITSYFNIVRRSMQDMVPKAIMHHLVNFTRECLQNRLVEKLYKSENTIEELLTEDPAVSKERDKYKSLLEVYKRSASLIADVC